MNTRSLALVTLCALVVPLRGEDWPHWRGPNRNSIVEELSGWKNGQWTLNQLWKTNVHEGCCSPLVVGDRLFVVGWKDNRNHVQCLNAKTGKPIWSVSYNTPRYARFANGDQSMYSGATSTPEYDADTQYLYTLANDGDLHCWDTSQAGKKVWELNLYDRYGAKQKPKVGRSKLRDYGYTSSPIVFENTFIVEVGSPRGTLVGFDKRTGKELWRSQHHGPAGHNGGPALMKVEGIPCVAAQHHNGLLVARLDSGNEGKTVAEVPWLTEWANNIASPSVFENNVVITSAYNQYKIARYEITLRGARKVWEREHASKVCSPVIYKGHVYWAWRTAICLDFESGKTVWEQKGYSDPGSCIITGDDRMIVYSGKGTLTLAETTVRSPTKFRELYRNKPLFRTYAWPHVVLAWGKLYCKDRHGNLICFALSKQE